MHSACFPFALRFSAFPLACGKYIPLGCGFNSGHIKQYMETESSCGYEDAPMCIMVHKELKNWNES